MLGLRAASAFGTYVGDGVSLLRAERRNVSWNRAARGLRREEACGASSIDALHNTNEPWQRDDDDRPTTGYRAFLNGCCAIGVLGS